MCIIPGNTYFLTHVKFYVLLSNHNSSHYIASLSVFYLRSGFFTFQNDMFKVTNII
jgi:hypothetical protein